MSRLLVAIALPLLACCSSGAPAPSGIRVRAGDQSVVLHWDQMQEPKVAGYRVYRSVGDEGHFAVVNPDTLLTVAGFCDLGTAVINGRPNYYRVTAVNADSSESANSPTVVAVPRAFSSDDDFLDYLEEVHFDYFWYLANPNNGLIPDRTAAGSACSIAAVGFGLSAIAVGIDRGWISREQGAKRVLTTLKTFWAGKQDSARSGAMGYHGWFYHFLDMRAATRTAGELSSIDTALLLAGMLDVREYFDAPSMEEKSIRELADAIVERVDWSWMARGTNVVSMGWTPETGFIRNNWVGYNEAMILYCLGLGATSNPLPASAWGAWARGYTWNSYYGLSFVSFPPLFGHQYSHCWIDFRHITDAYMKQRGSNYFENSRRASLAQRAYCVANPSKHAAYDGLVWGLTASDDPSGYSAHGAPPAQNDNGTIAPTAAGGSLPFTPEYSIPTLRCFYTKYREQLWTAFGFRDAFNPGAKWVDTDELGIDQGPIVLMIENYRTARVWRRFMQNPIVQRGLRRAGFNP
ncbi:MAG TPA: glucoamylase family protein [Verrucomicrobiae bacterium]|nr:glucoamylase family protein [Verrucomicrobiae bacterium]